MNYKKIMIILIITVIVVFAGVMGFSYAWYSLSNASTDFNVTTNNTDIAVTYAQSEYVNIATGVPIEESEVADKAGKSTFSVTAEASLTGYQVAIEIALTNVEIADALKVDDFKLQLVENGQVISTVTGAEITGSTIILKEMSNIEVGVANNYELRIWLNETGVSQNELMGQTFSGLIKVSSSVRR